MTRTMVAQCKLVTAILALSLLGQASYAVSTKDPLENAEQAAKNMKRDVQDSTCEWIHGKLECKAKQIKHKVEKKLDEAKSRERQQQRPSNGP